MAKKKSKSTKKPRERAVAAGGLAAVGPGVPLLSSIHAVEEGEAEEEDTRTTVQKIFGGGSRRSRIEDTIPEEFMFIFGDVPVIEGVQPFLPGETRKEAFQRRRLSQTRYYRYLYTDLPRFGGLAADQSISSKAEDLYIEYGLGKPIFYHYRSRGILVAFPFAIYDADPMYARALNIRRRSQNVIPYWQQQVIRTGQYILDEELFRNLRTGRLAIHPKFQIMNRDNRRRMESGFDELDEE